jgi:excisionase family DNA binding protein
MHDKLLRTDEVAVILDIPADRVATMAREGLLPAIRCGRSWRFAPARLRKWMESGGAGGWKRFPQSASLPETNRAERT